MGEVISMAAGVCQRTQLWWRERRQSHQGLESPVRPYPLRSSEPEAAQGRRAWHPAAQCLLNQELAAHLMAGQP